jgi:hypothetical protein
LRLTRGLGGMLKMMLAMNLTKRSHQKYFSMPDHRTFSRRVFFQRDQGGSDNCVAGVEVA